MKNILNNKLIYVAISTRILIYIFLRPYAERVKSLPFFCSRMTNFEEFKEAKYFIEHNLHPY